MSALTYHGIGQSNVGRNRSQNEDAFVADDDFGLYVVSDGMGGHTAGELASAQAVRSVKRVIDVGLESVADRRSAVALARSAVEQACLDVYRLATSDPEMAGMGCTLTVALVRDGYAAIAHVGDSRCYLQRDDQVGQLTEDHTVGGELARTGLVGAEELSKSRLRHVLSRAIGTHEAVQVDAFSIDLIGGDMLLLCSDGLSEYIPSDEWLADQLTGSTLDATAEALIEHANDEGGRDNITVVLVRLDAPSGARQERRSLQISGRLLAIASVFLFAELSTALLARLMSHCKVGRYADGETLVSKGERLDTLIVVTEGTLLIDDTDGKEELSAGEFAGITALLQPRTARASLVAKGDATVLTLSHEQLWKLAKKRPWLGINLLERLNRELGRALHASVSRRDDGKSWTTPLLGSERL